MNRLLLPLLLFPLMPVNASEPEIQCPGETTVEMQWCASQLREESEQSLKGELEPELLDKWKPAIQEVCAAVYAPYRRGSIYTQLIFGCNDRLNRALLDEFKIMGE